MRLRRIIVVCLTSVLIINILISYGIYNASLYDQVHANAEERLDEIARYSYYFFDNKLDEQIKRVEISAEAFGIADALTEEKKLALLASDASQNQLLRAALSDVNGDFITSDNMRGNVANEEFFQTAMAGEFHITNPTPAVVDKTKKVILLTAPVMRDEKVIGTLTFSYLCDELEAIFNLTQEDENIHTIVTNQAGDILIGDMKGHEPIQNIFTFFKSIQTDKADMKFISKKGTFNIESIDEDKSILAEYAQLHEKDWYAITIVKKQYTMKTINAMTELREKWNIYLLCSMAIYILLVVFIVRNHIYNVDKLTKLMTYKAFKKEANKILSKNKQQKFIIIKLDIRNFKLINRVYGFDVGNDVIKNMAASLKETLHVGHCLVARMTIDNFILMLPYQSKEEIDSLRETFIINFRRLMGIGFVDNIDFPTGQYIALLENRGNDSIDDIYEKVNFAHQIAKQSDLNLIVDYEETLEKNAIYQKDLEDRMHVALENEEFQLYLQPKYCLHNHKVRGAEALIRWVEKNGGVITPNQFIPLFEKNGTIVLLDKYIFEKVAIMIRREMDEGKEVYPISVNFSRLHLHNDNLVDELCAIADQYNVPHHLLEIELTESIVFDNIDIIISLINQLHEKGFTISIDDFGAGYSSLSLLKDVRVDVVKLDRAFFSIMGREKRSDIVIKNILRMTKELSIKTVAEGVETKEYVDFLEECQCDMIQGYYFSKPIPEQEYIKQYFDKR